jgi:DNA repair protein RadA/Sms
LANGIDTGRLLQVLAVLERRAGLSFAGQDVYVSVVGGLRIIEPAVDLPLALALASALKDRPVPLDIAAFGEIGLTGQVRPVSQAAARLREATRLGMKRVLGAAPASMDTTAAAGLERVATVSAALEILS